MPRTVGGGPMLAVIIVIVIIFLFSARFSLNRGSSNSQHPVISSGQSGGTSSTDPGADARLVAQEDMVPIGATAQNCDAYMQLLASGNRIGGLAMVQNGQIMLVPSGTKCHVITAGTPDDEIRIEEGNHSGQDVFVAAELVKR
jgi:hypothetical protein